MMLLDAGVRASEGVCPRCRGRFGRVHSRYQRRLADAAIAARRVVIRLRVRRFFCDKRRLPSQDVRRAGRGVAAPYARRTTLMRRMFVRGDRTGLGRSCRRPAGQPPGLGGQPRHAAAGGARARRPADRAGVAVFGRRAARTVAETFAKQGRHNDLLRQVVGGNGFAPSTARLADNRTQR